METNSTSSTGLSRLQSDAVTSVAGRIGKSLGNIIVTLIDNVFDMIEEEMSNSKNQQ